MLPKGKLFVLEGCDGSGKTTQVRMVIEWLREIGYQAETFREPGATGVGERIRSILLDPDTDLIPLAELFLFCAARVRNVEINVIPVLERGYHVILDRFTPSTLIYQYLVGGVPLDDVITLDQISRRGVDPGLVIILDIDPEEAIRRNLQDGQEMSRQDQNSLTYHQKIRDGYLALANQFGWQVIDGQKKPKEVLADIQKLILPVLQDVL